MDNGHYELVFTLYTAVSHATMIPVFHVCTTPVFHHPAVFKHGLGCLYLFLTISIIQHQRISLHIHNIATVLASFQLFVTCSTEKRGESLVSFLT